MVVLDGLELDCTTIALITRKQEIIGGKQPQEGKRSFIGGSSIGGTRFSGT